MSKRQFKSHASSGRATNALNGFGSSAFGTAQSSVLSYIQETPDYSTISDPNIVVALKNLSKKDGTTKAKALEDLQSFLNSSDFDVEEALLAAWAQLFPRLSIDNARRVRQLAHILNGQLCAKSGKRTVKFMPAISGPWLAGTYDNDRTVSRAASDALNLVFSSPEKLHGVRKAFQKPILDYCRNAALHETIQTLNDERTVSSDDAEATYARVVATSLSVISSLITELSAEVVDKEIQLYDETLGDLKLWEFVYHTDAGVRRSMHRLVQACLQARPNLIQDNLKSVSSSYVSKGLPSDQTGSALDFIQVLSSLTRESPSIWTDAYSGKKSVTSQLRQFLKHGSHSAPSGYWEQLNSLLRSLPTSVLPTTPEELADLLSSARIGVSRKEEKFNASAAWPAYFTLVSLVTSPLPDAEPILRAHVMPVFRQYLSPSPETADWTISGSRAPAIIAQATDIERLIPLIVHDWPLLTDELTEIGKLSLPEQSKDFEKSQKHVAGSGERWADLQRDLWNRNHDITLRETFTTSSNKVLQVCISLLKSRNGKPYGAAATIEQLLRTCGEHLMHNKIFNDTYAAFAENDIPKLAFSPSQRHLFHGLYATSSEQAFTGVFTGLLLGLLSADESNDVKWNALRAVFSVGMPSAAIQVANGTPELQHFLVQASPSGELGSHSDLFADLVKLGAVTSGTTDAILSELTAALTTSEQVGTVLSTIDVFTKSDSSALQTFLSTPGGAGTQLLPILLSLEQSPDDEVAGKAARLSSTLSSSISDTAPNSKFSVIAHNLEQPSQSSLPIEALWELAVRLMGPEGKVHSTTDMLPSPDVWLSAVQEIISIPKPSLALLSPLGGVLHLLHLDSKGLTNIRYDIQGFSQGLRISMFLTRLLAETDFLHHLGDSKAHLIAVLHISVLLAEDIVSVVGSNGLWSNQHGVDDEAAVLEFISEARKIINEEWKAASLGFDGKFPTETTTFGKALEVLRNDQDPFSPLSYYVSLALTETYTNLFELHGFSAEQSSRCATMLKERRSTSQTLGIVECITSFRQPLAGSQTLTRFCNELVTDLTDLDITTQEPKGLGKLITLNSILHTQDDATASIAKQRLIFLVKHLLPWLNDDTTSIVKVEVCKALTELLPGMQDIYGEHWEQSLSFLVTYWSSQTTNGADVTIKEHAVLLINATLRLFGTLKKLSRSEEPNDDLVDALKDKEKDVQDGLIHLLIDSNGADDDSHQPLAVTHELLARQIASLPFKMLEDVEELYPLLYTPSRSIQHAAFNLLHKHTSAAQEQISFDAALENKTARLPDELLSLVLEAPTLDSLVEASFGRMMPLSLQGYLYSWRLIFDHFDGASYRVKNDYIDQLKDGTYLIGLLDFTFDFLGHTRGKPADVSRFDIQNYIADSESSPEKDVQWLLTHLYYLALTHLPSQVKSYYLDIRSRQTSSAVESWTAKHLSPLLIKSSLQGVAEWADKSVKEDPEYEKMTVKVGMRSKEIYVSYEVDEQTMAIKVVLPDAYPLAPAQVVGVNRVAVKEEKWQSWLRNCQGVITFSNGSIVDGLTAWRKNVTGALKGQTECAICYSIVSADKQLPTKRCPTCKNLFHSGCLFKWFKTSNASTCPLCRNPFSFN